MLSTFYKIIVGLIAYYLYQCAFAAIADPCEGNILAIFKRPTVITSACTTPYKKFTFEAGVDYLEMSNKSNGWLSPQSKIRIGLPGRNEFAWVLPSEITNSKQASGLSPSQFSFKHNIYYNENWNTAVRVIYTPPSGSQLYGTAHDGYTLNGIVTYRLSTIHTSFMLGYSSLSTPAAAAGHGKRYTTLSPDALIGWQANDWLQLYAEVYGQFNSGPKQGPGYNVDSGLLFLFTKNIAADIEVGHRLSGHLGNFTVYYGTGISFLF